MRPASSSSKTPAKVQYAIVLTNFRDPSMVRAMETMKHTQPQGAVSVLSELWVEHDQLNIVSRTSSDFFSWEKASRSLSKQESDVSIYSESRITHCRISSQINSEREKVKTSKVELTPSISERASRKKRLYSTASFVM